MGLIVITVSINVKSQKSQKSHFKSVRIEKNSSQKLVQIFL